jgi:hypothetical protein
MSKQWPIEVAETEWVESPVIGITSDRRGLIYDRMTQGGDYRIVRYQCPKCGKVPTVGGAMVTADEFTGKKYVSSPEELLGFAVQAVNAMIDGST